MSITTIIFDVSNTLIAMDANAPGDDHVIEIAPMVDLLARLSKHYSVYALTSLSARDMAYFGLKFSFVELFKDIVTPDECGLYKSSPEIYQYFLTKHGLSADECIFIDDTAPNVKASEEAGLHGIVFESFQKTIEALEKLGIEVGE